MNNTYVYALLDTRKPGPFFYGHWKFEYEPFYIGKGKGTRFIKHVRFAEYGHNHYNQFKYNKIRKILREGFEVGVRFLKQELDDSVARALEIKLIALIGRADLKFGPLVNLTNGGDGMSGHVWSTKTRRSHKRRIAARDASELSETIKTRLAKRSPEEKAQQVENWKKAMSSRSDVQRSEAQKKRRKTLQAKVVDPKVREAQTKARLNTIMLRTD